jgi:hypothetical protein
MRISAVYSFLGLIFVIISTSLINAQVNWNINSEGGCLNSKGSYFSKPRDLLFRTDGNLSYFYLTDDVSASVKFKVRPEFYGFRDNFRSLKFKASGGYNQKDENMNWGITLTGQKNFYQNNITDFNYSTFLLAVNSDWNEFGDYPISAQLGYAYQTASENIEQNLDLLFLEIKIFKTLFPNNSSGLGFYVERFTIDNKYLSKFTNSTSTNKGMRYGPQISFYYLENGIVSIEYRFLLHSSQVTQYPSYEHWIRFIAGKIFSEKWSIFLLADYYNRRFTLKQVHPVETFLIYNPLDNENKVNIKLAYEINNSFEVYLKSGYFKENFFDQQFNFEGWNMLLGIEIGN